MTDHSRQAAWMQAALLLAAAVIVAVLLVARLQRPFDRDTLAIQVGQLRSQSAEAATLARQSIADHMNPGVVRQHVRQLHGAVARVQAALQDKDAQPALSTQLLAARRLGAALAMTLQDWSVDAARAPRAVSGLDRVTAQLDALDRQLQPEG